MNTTTQINEDKTQASGSSPPAVPKENPVRDGRLGQFKLSRLELANNTAGVQALMAQIIVIDCEFDPASSCYSYIAYSKYFAKAAVGVDAPNYHPLLRPSGKFIGFAAS